MTQEESIYQYSNFNIDYRFSMGRACSQNEGRSAFKNLTFEPTGKRPLGRPRRRWEDNIRMDLEVIGINVENWVD